MRAAALRIELRFPYCASLKDKRRLLRPIVERLRRRLSVSVAEVDHHDAWQRAAIGVAIVAGDTARLERLISLVQDYVDDHDPEVQVVDVTVGYLEEHG